MSSRTRKPGLSFEQAYIKAICKAQRETVGLQPAITRRNRRKYRRADAKQELRRMSEY